MSYRGGSSRWGDTGASGGSGGFGEYQIPRGRGGYGGGAGTPRGRGGYGSGGSETPRGRGGYGGSGGYGTPRGRGSYGGSGGYGTPRGRGSYGDNNGGRGKQGGAAGGHQGWQEWKASQNTGHQQPATGTQSTYPQPVAGTQSYPPPAATSQVFGHGYDNSANQKSYGGSQQSYGSRNNQQSYGNRGNPRSSADSNPNKTSLGKRKADEMDWAIWTSSYDGPLPGEILSLCTEFECGMCAVQLTSAVVRTHHYQGAPHHKKVDAALKEYAKKNGGSVPKKKKVSATEVDTKVDSMVETSRLEHWQKEYTETWDRELPNVLLKMCRPSRCELCMVKFNSTPEGQSHLMGKKHDKKVTEWLKEFCELNNEVLPVKKVSAAPEDSAAAGVIKGDHNTDRRFGIGVDFVKKGIVSTTKVPAVTPSTVHTTTPSTVASPAAAVVPDKDAAVSAALKAMAASGETDGWAMKSEEFWAKTAQDQTTKTNQELKGRGHTPLGSNTALNNQARSTVVTSMSANTTANATAQLMCAPFQYTGNSVKRKKSKNSSSVQLVCEPCGVTATSQVNMDMHLAGKSHIKKVSTPIPATATEGVEKKKGMVVCEPCGVTATSQENMDMHLAGKSHMKKVSTPIPATSLKCVRCDVCNITTDTKEMMSIHLAGSKHAKKLLSKKSESQAQQPVQGSDP